MTYDREQLIAQLESRMSHPQTGVCEIQAALSALGYSTGAIDGKMGPQTRAAVEAFESRWMLPAHSFRQPVFISALARALTGEVAPK